MINGYKKKYILIYRKRKKNIKNEADFCLLKNKMVQNFTLNNFIPIQMVAVIVSMAVKTIKILCHKNHWSQPYISSV